MQRLNLLLRSSLTCLCATSTVDVAAFACRSKSVALGSAMSSIDNKKSSSTHHTVRHSETLLRMASNTAPCNKPDDVRESGGDAEWKEVLPFVDSSHGSATITVPSTSDDDDIFRPSTFSSLLKNTVAALRDLEKTSVWVEIPMSRAGLIEDMEDLGFEFHHAQRKTAKLNLWLKEVIPSKVPEFATHHLGVGSVVINSRNEILCIRELRQNYMPYKIPTGLSERGESIAEAAEREVLEETGISAKFDGILSFRHTHGMAHGRSDIFFVCNLIPKENNGEIPVPVPQACEIAEAKWVPLSQYRDMIDGVSGGKGHPMMSFVMNKIFDEGKRIHTKEVQSVVPGRLATPMYFPSHKLE